MCISIGNAKFFVEIAEPGLTLPNFMTISDQVHCFSAVFIIFSDNFFADFPTPVYSRFAAQAFYAPALFRPYKTQTARNRRKRSCRFVSGADSHSAADGGVFLQSLPLFNNRKRAADARTVCGVYDNRRFPAVGENKSKIQGYSQFGRIPRRRV